MLTEGGTWRRAFPGVALAPECTRTREPSTSHPGADHQVLTQVAAVMEVSLLKRWSLSQSLELLPKDSLEQLMTGTPSCIIGQALEKLLSGQEDNETVPNSLGQGCTS